MAELKRYECRMYGSEQLMPVEIEEPECPHCKFVSQYVTKSGAGEISYVCLGPDDDDIRRVQTVWTLGALALLCNRVSADEVEEEMRQLAEGSA